MASASWTRRTVLLSIASISTWPLTVRSSMAGTPDPRLLVLCLRGGIDGLAVAAPTFDPNYLAARGDFGGFDRLGDEHGLDGGYRLNPRLRFVGELLRSGTGHPVSRDGDRLPRQIPFRRPTGSGIGRERPARRTGRLDEPPHRAAAGR